MPPEWHPLSPFIGERGRSEQEQMEQRSNGPSANAEWSFGGMGRRRGQTPGGGGELSEASSLEALSCDGLSRDGPS